MTYFYQTDAVLQTVLLVFSQLTVASFAAGFILLFKHKSKVMRQIGMVLGLALNAALYVMMQLDSRITMGERGSHIPLPYALLLLLTLLSAGGSVWSVLQETRHRKSINHTSIKEAFDNLPTAVCFFNGVGLPVLCNLGMQRFSFAVCGKDVQFVSDLENCLAEDFVPLSPIKKEGSVFLLPDGSVRQLKKRVLTHENGDVYTRFTATDITDLYRNREELQRENRQLRRVQEELGRLSANVVAVTREEEILNTKMRVHDEMGRCLMEARKCLQEDSVESVSDSVITSWKRAVSMIKYSSETEEEDMLLQIRKTCSSVGLSFVQNGILPDRKDAAYILTCAVRECVTNAVRYADASELYADFEETESEASVTVTNNGKVPEGEIVEGGGLSTLRRRVERAGGVMRVESAPIFRLRVTLPKGKEGVL